MAYARFSDGDVYVYATMLPTHSPGRGVREALICCACRLTDMSDGCHQSVEIPTPQKMIEHLEAHEKAGHRVPKHAKTRLLQEIKDRR